MSLNFVSTSVLTSTDGVSHDTETDLGPSSGPTEYVKPLFEQLRKNAQEAQDQYDEITKTMRGAKTLDEEDAAYIESLEEKKMQVLHKTKRQEDEEVQMFHAARLEKSMMSSMENDFERESTFHNKMSVETNISSSSSLLLNMKAPKLLKKRRRQPVETDDTNTAATKCNTNQKIGTVDAKTIKTDEIANYKEEKESKKDNTDTPKNLISSLGVLLAYDTDSDSE